MLYLPYAVSLVCCISSVSIIVERPAKGKLTTSDLVVDAGDRIQLHCRGRGKPTPTLTWIKDGRVLHADGREIRIREKKYVTVIMPPREGTMDDVQ